MKQIPISKGQVALIDDEDYDKVTRMGNWYFDGKYAMCIIKGPKGRLTARMHEILIYAGPGKVTDHIDRNGLNNQKSNLRITTQSVNGQNRKLQKNNTSGYKGVWVTKVNVKYRSAIKVNDELVHLGYFSTAEAAARAYDKAAISFFGPIANLNFPNQNAT